MSTNLREVVDELLSLEDPTRGDIDKVKTEFARAHGLNRVPRNSELIAVLNEGEKRILLPVLRRKMARTMSGVSVVAVMTEPRPCPHGRCAYCPGGPGGEDPSPQSYTGYEPAAMRGRQNEYDPYRQVRARICQLKSIGQLVDKVDLILMGGTFPASPRPYQEAFIKGCLDALTGLPSTSFAEAKANSESHGIRNVGITVETRPDCVNEKDVDSMLDLGVTRVELGVQNIYDDIYERVGRGHTIADVVSATRMLKDSALKVCYHMMPGLPGSDIDRDIEGFRTIFENSRFKPDMLKIYPTLVVRGTKLYDWWKSGEYTPLTTEQAVEVIAKVKKITPPWVRIMRVQRDIPFPRIDAGPDKGNLRQLAREKLAMDGERCRCIRCREAGHSEVRLDPKKVEITSTSYDASGGSEVFVQAEDREADTLVGFVRLRIPGISHRPEITSGTTLVRELHVYGRMVPVGERFDDAWQHQGWGVALMGEAERAARDDYGAKKMVVMSALGTKEYYARLGYSRDGPYVSKNL